MKFLTDILAKSNLVVDGVVTLNTVNAASVDTDKFLVVDNGVVKFRTGAQLLSDIGAAAAAAGLPVGGTTGQILAKIDNTNYNVQWIDNYAPKIQHIVKLGTTMTAGTPVYVSSSDGTNMIVSAASNTTEATSSKTLGLLVSGGVTNDQRFVVTEGLLAGLDTSTAAAGDPVWLGPNGTLLFGLANKPVAPLHMVFIGIVTRVQQNNGEIFVKVQNGYELNELHDVSLPSYINNGVLYRDTSTNLWKHATIATILGYTPANSTSISGTTNYVAKFTSAGAVGNSQIFDNGTFVGIGTTSNAGYKLDVTGTARVYHGLTVSDYGGLNTTYSLIAYTNGNTEVFGIKNGAVYSNGNFAVFNNYTQPYYFYTNLGYYFIPANSRGVANLDWIYAGGTMFVAGGNTNQNTGWVSVKPTFNYNSTPDAGTKFIGFYYSPTNFATLGTQHYAIVAEAGQVQLGDLAGTGSRMVVASATGVLSTQAIPSGTLTGTGTINYVPKWTSTSALGNSQIFDDGTNVGIGTSSPGYKLDVVGVIYTNNSVNVNNYGTLSFDTTGNGRMRVKAIANRELSFGANNLNENMIIGLTGNVGINATSLISGIQLTINTTAGGPVSSGTAQTAALRLQSGANNGVIDFGTNSSANGWIQVTNRSSLDSNFNLLLNPNGGSVAIGTSSPAASAKLEIASTTQGFLPPRMTAAQRGAISSPATGLVVYQTDGNEGLWLYTVANGWRALAIVV